MYVCLLVGYILTFRKVAAMVINIKSFDCAHCLCTEERDPLCAIMPYRGKKFVTFDNECHFACRAKCDETGVRFVYCGKCDGRDLPKKGFKPDPSTLRCLHIPLNFDTGSTEKPGRNTSSNTTYQAQLGLGNSVLMTFSPTVTSAILTVVTNAPVTKNHTEPITDFENGHRLSVEVNPQHISSSRPIKEAPHGGRAVYKFKNPKFHKLLKDDGPGLKQIPRGKSFRSKLPISCDPQTLICT